MRRAFTLIELLAVIAIVAVLAALLFPVIGRAKRKAHEPVDVSNMRQIYMCLVMYEEDFGGASPMAIGVLDAYAREPRVFASLDDVYRKPYPDATWPAHALMPCAGGRSPFKISYAYLRSFPPFDEEPDRWRTLRDDPSVGILASPWSGDPLSIPNLAFPCGDRVVDTLGPPMEGPILRVNMDGSFYRLAKNRNEGAIGSPPDLFFNR